MTVKTIYDSAGMIVRVVHLTGDPVEDALIENIPVGGASVDGDYDMDTVYFVAGVATARPTVTVDPAYEIVADGEDSFWFEVPDETVIVTPDGEFEATVADALVSVSSTLIGDYSITVVPPLPYQQANIEVAVIPDDGGSPNLPPTTPDIEILLSQTALTGLAVLAKPKFNVVSWDASIDPEHDHYGLTRYESETDADDDVDGVDIEPITEAFYKDADEFVNGVDCWYRVWDVDTNGNQSEKSDPVGEVARGVRDADIENKTISPLSLSDQVGLAVYSFSGITNVLDDNAQNILEEVTLALEPVDTDAATVTRTFVMHGQLSSVGGALPANAFRIGFDYDDGSGYICTANETPLELILWKPENGASVCPYFHVYEWEVAPDVTSIKIAFKCWMLAGNSASVTDTRWMVQQTNVRIL